MVKTNKSTDTYGFNAPFMLGAFGNTSRDDAGTCTSACRIFSILNTFSFFGFFLECKCESWIQTTPEEKGQEHVSFQWRFERRPKIGIGFLCEKAAHVCMGEILGPLQSKMGLIFDQWYIGCSLSLGYHTEKYSQTREGPGIWNTSGVTCDTLTATLGKPTKRALRTPHTQ